MIAMLRGRVVSARLGELVLDVHGVGYRVRVPPASFGKPGDELVLHTHLAVREDAMTLYGFPEAAARDLFEVLLSVTGFGPKLALAAIGTLGAEGLRRAVLAEDVHAITAVPGVGKKSAQRVILELREKLGAGAGGDLPGGGELGGRAEVREALAALGYAPAEVQRALQSLPDGGDAPVEELLRQALRALDPAAV
ncbi:MAG TPA: Holliday junction branch migration protein RuvA [Egibacteraceae bacterium]|nr:Holliday junction branch migration protein RuvA [Egibacteraceae bacterium]